jgi:hypothetical protein
VIVNPHGTAESTWLCRNGRSWPRILRFLVFQQVRDVARSCSRDPVWLVRIFYQYSLHCSGLAR